MSFDGHVDCQRIEVGPVAAWPLPIIGNANAPAPAAPARNLRRVGDGLDATVLSVVMDVSSVGLRFGTLCSGSSFGRLERPSNCRIVVSASGKKQARPDTAM